MRLKSYGGTMTVSHQATVKFCHNSVWFSENVVTNIISLRNLRLQYLVTYNIEEMLFIVHRESEGKTNIQFRMHDSGLHYFFPRDQEFTFVNNASVWKYFPSRIYGPSSC